MRRALAFISFLMVDMFCRFERLSVSLPCECEIVCVVLLE
jgi:hypothetical protein